MRPYPYLNVYFQFSRCNDAFLRQIQVVCAVLHIVPGQCAVCSYELGKKTPPAVNIVYLNLMHPIIKLLILYMHDTKYKLSISLPGLRLTKSQNSYTKK